MHDELAAAQTLERRAAEQRDELLVERAVKRRNVHLQLPEDPHHAAEEGDVVRLPLLGEIAAGGPLLAEQNIEEYVPMPGRSKGDFMLRVKGESMIEAGILDGDLVIVQRTQDARNGEIVVALAGDDESADEATVKTFYRESDRVRLQPENSSMEPIYARHVQILGKVIGVFRRL